MLRITCIIIFEATSFQDLDFFCKGKKSGTWEFAELDNFSCGIYVDLTLNSLSLQGAVFFSILDVIKNYPSNPLTFSEPNQKRVSYFLLIIISQHINGCFLFCL